MRVTLRLIFLLVVLSIVSPANAGSEFRGIWVDAWHPGLANHDDVSQMVVWAKSMHLNALIVQVRRRGDAFYNSKIEPKAADVVADYDPLADVIAQAHAAGLQVHAWLSILEVGNSSKWFRPAPTHIYVTHPDWLTCNEEGNRVFSEGRMFVDPGVPAVQDHIVAVVSDMVKTYKVDGIHLDNIYYPEKQSGYNAVSVARFNKETGSDGTPYWNDPVWIQWRAQQVTNLVSRIRTAVQSAKPAVCLSASVRFSDPKLAAEHVMQDWDSWISSKLVDFVVPLAFAYAPESDAPNPGELLKYSHDRYVYIGIPAWNLSADQTKVHIEAARQAGSKGVVLYNYHSLGPNSTGSTCIGETDLAAQFAQGASLPAMPWKSQ